MKGPAAMPTAAPTRRRRTLAVDPADARRLSRLTVKIASAEDLWDERASQMSALWEGGCSLGSIADSAGVTREAARKSILRWRARTTA